MIYERLETLHGILQEEIELLRIEDKINQRVRANDQVTEGILFKEQLKAIQSELGEGNEISNEIEEYRTKLDKIKMPKDVKEKVLNELDRLTISPHSPEVGVRNYLDWIIDYPGTRNPRARLISIRPGKF